MTAARMAGPSILEKYGRVLAVRSGALLVGLGVLAVVVGPQVGEAAGRTAGFAVAAVGSLAWGVGAALGFPVGMSAAADDPERAAARVSVVSAIGYVAFLAGPPILGLLGDRVGVVRALLAVGGAVVVSLLAAGSLRPLPQPSGNGPASATEPSDGK
jgi:cyanate permease